jgi:PAS domain S-box-containing protein
VAGTDEWSRLFAAAFRQSRNPMVLADGHRRQVDANGAYLKLLGYALGQVVGHPISEFNVDERMPQEEWEGLLASGQFTGKGQLRRADGTKVRVEFAATVESMTGRRLILFVALSTSVWGGRLRRADTSSGGSLRGLTKRERTIVRLIALGRTGPEIAEELQIAHETVRTHVRNAMEKLGARSRAQLVAKVLGDGHALI